MIIFDDAEYVDLLVRGEAPKHNFRNNVLRSCAKMIHAGKHDIDEVYEAILAYTDYEIEKELLESYVSDRGDTRIYAPHEIGFGLNELKNIYKLRTKNERKYYLAQLFCFKYFESHRLRIAGREFKRIAGISLSHNSLTTTHLGRGISVRRETHTKKVKREFTNEKPYYYYYPLEKIGRIVFTYKYEGDSFMLPSVEWNSNISELWKACEEASYYNL